MLAALLLTGCIVQSGSSSRKAESLINEPNNVGAYQSYVMTTNPVEKSGGDTLTMGISLSTYLDITPQFITDQQILSDSATISYPNPQTALNLTSVKFEVRKDENADYLYQNMGTWAYGSNTSEFQEVNTFYLLKKEIVFFQEALWNQASLLMNNTSMPGNFSIKEAYWPYSINQTTSIHTPLTLSAYTQGMDEKQASFFPAEFVLRFGMDSELSGTHLDALYFSQDPSIIFHETGHAMVHIMMNIRNLAQENTVATRLGYRFYDEAGSINEGLADYFSYTLTGHTSFGSWGLGNFYGAARPISEDNFLHAAGISEDNNERLRYPDFLNYDPNTPTKLYEDIHQAGMITSHYLVALSRQLMTNCTFDHEVSNKYIMGILSETMAQMGDLQAEGIDGKTDFVNLNEAHALEWIQTVNPITYRSFFQTFAFKLNQLRIKLADVSICTNFTQDDIEQLLDHYGLLLFKSYNDDGNSELLANNTLQVNSLNQLKSTLILKEHIGFDPTAGASIAYVFDKRESIANAIQAFLASGFLSADKDLTSPTLIPSDYSYNNENGLISPGELVGISLNLYNSSNSSMAGVQVLANDWDHAKDGKPCRHFENVEDIWPTDSEGAASAVGEANVAESCTYTTRDNEHTSPVCFLQLNEEESTQWVSQEKFRADRGLEAKNCLGGDLDTQDCYVRAVNHLDSAMYSKIDSHKTWMQTITASEQDLIWHSSNLLFFEINPWVPPGTKVNCRLRVRFTNCADCFEKEKDGKADNFDDFEYSGAQPFKLINFQFIIID